jgi:phosphohistidine phosphatase
MKHLTIVRHAKAERPELHPKDFVRPLTPRGHKDAERLGEVLVKIEPPVDCVLSSPATRAAQTAEHLAAAIAYTKPIDWNDAVYDAHPVGLLNAIQGVADDCRHVMVVGHNPSLEEFVSGLIGTSPEDVIVTLSTASIAHLELEATHWGLVRWGTGRLKLLVAAKYLK